MGKVKVLTGNRSEREKIFSGCLNVGGYLKHARG
jgi:hypothetical protein